MDFIKEVSRSVEPQIIQKAQSARQKAGGSVSESNVSSGKGEEGEENLFVRDLIACNQLDESGDRQAGGSSVSSSDQLSQYSQKFT